MSVCRVCVRCGGSQSFAKAQKDARQELCVRHSWVRGPAFQHTSAAGFTSSRAQTRLRFRVHALRPSVHINKAASRPCADNAQHQEAWGGSVAVQRVRLLCETPGVPAEAHGNSRTKAPVRVSGVRQGVCASGPPRKPRGAPRSDATLQLPARRERVHVHDNVCAQREAPLEDVPVCTRSGGTAVTCRTRSQRCDGRCSARHQLRRRGRRCRLCPVCTREGRRFQQRLPIALKRRTKLSTVAARCRTRQMCSSRPVKSTEAGQGGRHTRLRCVGREIGIASDFQCLNGAGRPLGLATAAQQRANQWEAWVAARPRVPESCAGGMAPRCGKA